MEVISRAVEKLWMFVVGVLAAGCKPWRIVISKTGRLGHGELRCWCHFLHKEALKKTSQYLRGQCGQCSQMPGYADTPAILSACLVSLEPETHLRVFPSVFRPDERFGVNAKHCPLSTPEDSSSTHIMVFPTRVKLEEGATVGPGVEEDDDTFFKFDDLEMMEGLADLPLPPELFGDLGAPPSATTPARSSGGQPSFFPHLPISETAEEISEQPLALGFYISTAGAEGLPDWFWAPLPGARRRTPSHLRAALHLNTQKVQDDEGLETGPPGSSAISRPAHSRHSPAQAHPLDSNTEEVLRYVLETFNALSWLNVDLGTGDRRSCLPVHIQALLKLYQTTSALLAD